ncbi:D-tyrosyl-tRNA(Tyr) deacylase [Balneicella halophila]|uniref:D-aminoacyl-tRNA deacylase n=1 Tax=Balneicella halophila TaxID=1537566 RepID=A0A7L4UR52_BALHA|nr:D-aminoacyl-tRNA deacylase [Balneicella halophila]PVX52230.1 D-tyrosyl-tRNA(Tyr) deacylase [Balneicella halophila]
MRAVIQRVSEAILSVEHIPKCSIELGLVVLLGIEHEDTEEDASWLAKKIANLRIFYNDEGVKDLSVIDVNGEILVVSQFTLYARTKKGNRPAYIDAAHPDISKPLYELFVKKLQQEINKKIMTGIFGSYMQINMINDGPVTIIIDTKANK